MGRALPALALDVIEITGSWKQIAGRCVGSPIESVIVPEVLEISPRKVENALELSELTPWISTFCSYTDPANASEPTVIHHRVSHLDRIKRRYSLDKLENRPVLVEEIPDASCANSGRYQYLFESMQPTLL